MNADDTGVLVPQDYPRARSRTGFPIAPFFPIETNRNSSIIWEAPNSVKRILLLGWRFRSRRFFDYFHRRGGLFRGCIFVGRRGLDGEGT